MRGLATGVALHVQCGGPALTSSSDAVASAAAAMTAATLANAGHVGSAVSVVASSAQGCLATTEALDRVALNPDAPFVRLSCHDAATLGFAAALDASLTPAASSSAGAAAVWFTTLYSGGASDFDASYQSAWAVLQRLHSSMPVGGVVHVVLGPSPLAVARERPSDENAFTNLVLPSVCPERGQLLSGLEAAVLEYRSLTGLAASAPLQPVDATVQALAWTWSAAVNMVGVDAHSGRYYSVCRHFAWVYVWVTPCEDTQVSAVVGYIVVDS